SGIAREVYFLQLDPGQTVSRSLLVCIAWAVLRRLHIDALQDQEIRLVPFQGLEDRRHREVGVVAARASLGPEVLGYGSVGCVPDDESFGEFGAPRCPGTPARSYHGIEEGKCNDCTAHA